MIQWIILVNEPACGADLNNDLTKTICRTHQRIAQVLEVSPDYLINGTLEDKAVSSISDQELLNQFKKVEKFPQDKKMIVKELIEASANGRTQFILKTNLQQQLAS